MPVRYWQFSVGILLWGATIVIAHEVNSLGTAVNYKPYKISWEPNHTKWISECRNQRQNSGVHIIHRSVRLTPEGCLELVPKPILQEGKGSYVPCSNLCRGRTITISDLVLNSWSLSVLMSIQCFSNFLLKLLTWQDISIQIQCNDTRPTLVHLTSFEEKVSYRIEKSATISHLLVQKRPPTSSYGQFGRRMTVYINGSYVKHESVVNIEERATSRARTRTALTIGSEEGVSDRNISGGVILKALELYKYKLSIAEIKRESHFMYLKSINADYPECLCTVPPPYGTDSCPNREDRLRGEEYGKPFLPLRAVMDGIINTVKNYGFWPAKRKDVIVLELDTPTLLSGMDMRMNRQPITVLKDICDCGLWLSLFCASGLKQKKHPLCEERPGTYQWEQREGNPLQTLKWYAGQEIHIVQSLKIVFEGGPNGNTTNNKMTLENINPIYEIHIFGSELDNVGFPGGLPCFPGNGHMIAEYEECGRCQCRDEKASSSLNSCKPYINSLVPDYGPVSGGSNLTLSGGLLSPDIKRYENTTILVGSSALCSDIHRTDNYIICRTLPLVNTDLVGLRQHLKVNILIDGATYTIESQQGFTYKPDPIIEEVTPYVSYLEGSHEVTIKGKHLDSIFFKPEDHILTIYPVGIHEYKASCVVKSSDKMVCTMPKIEYEIVVKAYLGLTLDDVTQYKNLSAALPLGLKEPMKIYPKPSFIKEEMVKIQRDLSTINLKGERIDNGCSASDYKVKIGESECKVVKINYNSLSCIPPHGLDSHGSILLGQVVVRLYNYTYEIGYFQYEPSSNNNFMIIISIVMAFLLVILVACGLFIFWRRRNLIGVPSLQEDIQGPSDKVIIPVEDTTPNQTSYINKPLVDGLKEILAGIEIDYRNLEIKEEIGRGHYGKVYSGTLKQGSDEKEVAVKTLRDNPETDPMGMKEFLKEATMMKGFEHPNVMSLLGITIDNGQAFVVLPYVEHGDLRGFVQNSRFEEVRFTKLIYDVAKGMDYLAERKFVHRDLAARNCMVDSSENVLVGDFGLARDIHESDYYRPKDRSQPLPYKWMAPESIEDRNFSLKSDVWSYGVLAWEVFSHGVKPYPDIENFQLNSYLKRGLRLDQPPTCPLQLYDIMCQCWKNQPGDRPSFSQIVNKLEQILQKYLASSSANKEPKYVNECVLALLDAGLLQPMVYKPGYEGTTLEHPISRGHSTTLLDEACGNISLTTVGSGSEARVDEKTNQQSKPGSFPKRLLPEPRVMDNLGKLESKANEDTDYLQPICKRGVTACHETLGSTN